MDSKLFANIILLVVFVYASVGNLMAWGFNKMKWIPLTKPLLMPVLAIYYALNCKEVEYLVLFALLFAFLGDVFLIWPQKKVCFILGLVFFLVMQVLYIIFIISQQLDQWSFSWPVAVAGIVLLSIGILIYTNLFRYLNEMKIPVLVYMLIVLTVGFLCFANMYGDFTRYNLIEFVGALFFVASDTLLAFDSFKKPIRLGNLWIMATYINAQLLLLVGFMNI